MKIEEREGGRTRYYVYTSIAAITRRHLGQESGDDEPRIAS